MKKFPITYFLKIYYDFEDYYVDFTMSQKPSIIICGNYGIQNIGDEAILQGILLIVRGAFPQARITVLSSKPTQTSHEYQVKSLPYWPAGFRSFFTFRWWRNLKSYYKADAILLGGGGLFADEKPQAPFIWTMQVFAAFLLRKPVFCFAQSVGPLQTSSGRKLAKFVFQKAKFVTVRDDESKKLLGELGVGNVHVLADPAFALSYTHPTFEKRGEYIVLTLRPWMKGDQAAIDQELALFIRWVYTKFGFKTLFVPFQKLQENDEARYEALRKIIPEDFFELYEGEHSVQGILKVTAGSQAVVGMRLHSVIFSSITQTPFLALSYSEKVRNFVKSLDCEQFLEYENLDFDTLKKNFVC